MKRSQVPPFKLLGVEWQAFVADDGAYVWRAGELLVGRLGALCWAQAGEKKLGYGFRRLVDAMRAAIEAKR